MAAGDDGEEQDKSSSKDAWASGKGADFADTPAPTSTILPTNTKTAAAATAATAAATMTTAKTESDVEMGEQNATRNRTSDSDDKKSICIMVEHDIAVKKMLAAAKPRGVEAQVLKNYIADGSSFFLEEDRRNSLACAAQHYHDMRSHQQHHNQNVNLSNSSGRPGAYLAHPGTSVAERIEGGAALITPIPDVETTRTSQQSLMQQRQFCGQESTTWNSSSNSCGLAVADPVQESSRSFPHATQVLNPTTENSKNQAQSANGRSADAKKGRKALIMCIIIGGVVVLLAVGLVVLAIRLVGGFGSNEDDQSDMSPTQSPTTTTTTIWSLQSHLAGLLPQQTMERIFQEPQSPQALAFDWLLRHHDPTSSSTGNLSDARLVQRFTLATLFYSTNGTNWSNNLGWLSTDHECTWHSQTHGLAAISEGTDQLYPDPGTRCNNGDGIYRHLWLNNNNLQGEIPIEVFQLLTSLQSLMLHDNRRLKGQISSELGGSFPNLEALTVGRTEMEGTLPSQLGQAKRIKLLSTYKTALTGSIPSQFGLLTALEALHLHETPQLGGTIPSQIGKLSALRQLYLFRSNLMGTLPSELGHLSSLVLAELHKTNLEGLLPTELGLLNNTKKLSLGRNKLFGAIPSQIGTMQSLESLALHDNNLGGTLPSELGLLTKLTKLRIQENDQMLGIVPDSICWLTIAHSLSDFRVDRTDIQCPSNCSCTS